MRARERRRRKPVSGEKPEKRSVFQRVFLRVLFRARFLTFIALELDKVSLEGFRKGWLSQRSIEGFPNSRGLIIKVAGLLLRNCSFICDKLFLVSGRVPTGLFSEPTLGLSEIVGDKVRMIDFLFMIDL